MLIQQEPQPLPHCADDNGRLLRSRLPGVGGESGNTAGIVWPAAVDNSSPLGRPVDALDCDQITIDDVHHPEPADPQTVVVAPMERF